METMNNIQDYLAYKWAVNLIDHEIEKSTPVTEALIIEKVKELIANPMCSDNSKLFTNEIIQELLENRYAPLVIKNSLPLGVSLSDPREHVDWQISTNFYWQQIHYPFICDNYRAKDPNNWTNIIGSIDNESNSILKLMESPNRDKFDSKGLVIGYVQSGKTANFTALISKALDSGYKLVIVLGGMHDSLRIQTQNRLNTEILGFDDLILDPSRPEPTVKSFYEKGTFQNRRPERLTTSRYQQVGAKKTTMEAKGDFVQKQLLQDIVHPIEQYKTCVAVVKKNAIVLRRVFDWIQQCPASIRNQIPILIIDDEADQASVDANYNRNIKRINKQSKSLKINKRALNDEATAINKLIKGIVDSFDKSAYVGYTATPFANVFIDADQAYSNLYPHSFIHILPKPKAYFGANEIFGDTKYLNAYVVTQGVEDKKVVNGLLATNDFPSTLYEAILSFLICVAIRLERGNKNEAMSMLIHINHKNTEQELVFSAVQNKMSEIKKLIKYKNKQGTNLKNDIKNLYHDIVKKGKTINTTRNVQRSFSTESKVLNQIVSILEKNIINLKKVNGQSDDELDYDINPALKVIAIGGNKLSRGLTLEGLMVSYFLRDSNNADTLMQMGRFFGYRSGYNDLMKIYTTEQLVSDFSELIECENLLRSEVERYVDEGKTPKDFAPAVIEFLNMKPSGKMGNAKLNKRAFGLSESQTFKFKLTDYASLKKNMDSAVSFLNDLFTDKNITFEESKTSSGSKYFSNVPKSLVINFLEKIDIGNININQKELIEYLKVSQLENFNIGIPTNSKKGAVVKAFGKLGDFGLVDRSREPDEDNGYFNIGTLSSPSDKNMDMADSNLHYLADRKLPLILLYRINKDSKAKAGGTRKDLFDGIPNKHDVLGLSVLLPDSGKSELNYWVNRVDN